MTIFYAILYAAGGYWKAHSVNGEAFDGGKFVTTILIGFLVGIVQVATGFSTVDATSAVTSFLLTSGLIYTLETYGKVIWGYLQPTPAPTPPPTPPVQ